MTTERRRGRRVPMRLSSCWRRQVLLRWTVVFGVAHLVGCMILSVPFLRGEDGDNDGQPSGPEERPRDARNFREVYARSPVTKAVDRGLEYLRGKQLKDGSWISPGYDKNTGIVSLVIMAFLARGHEPGRGPYGEVLDRAIIWILENQHQGMIVSAKSHGPMYSHGISTLMLGEVIGMVSESRSGFERIHRVHRTAVNVILRAQNVPKRTPYDFGGWRYYRNSDDADLSVTGWQLLALRAAQEVGWKVPKKNIDQAVNYVLRCAEPGGGFRYQPYDQTRNIAMTGTGILSLQICGQHDSRAARQGGDWLLRHPLRWEERFFYYSAYYAAQAMYQLGGKHWERWRPISESVLLGKQSTEGSWPVPPSDMLEGQAGTAYTTAMAILSLAVEFHYLPIYQR